MDEIGRNKPLDFAQRTMKNLEFVYTARQSGEDVHEVTQLMNSTLGLIVFVDETKVIDSTSPLTWDQARSMYGLMIREWTAKQQTLSNLLHRLRNAIAHRHVHFSSDSRSWKDVIIRFWDIDPKTGKRVFEASIKGDHLKGFCDKIVELAQYE